MKYCARLLMLLWIVIEGVAFAETKPPSYAVVTTASLHSYGEGSLNAAIEAMSNADFVGPDGTRTITFDMPDTVIMIDRDLFTYFFKKPFTIDGYNGGRGVTFKYAMSDGNPMFVIGHDLTFRNLTVDGANASSSAIVRFSQNATFKAYNCSFRNSNAEYVFSFTYTSNVLERCSFVDNKNAVIQNAWAKIVSCSFVNNGDDFRSQSVNWQPVISSTVDDRFYQEDRTFTNCMSYANSSAAFMDCLRTQVVESVEHVYRPTWLCDDTTNGLDVAMLPEKDLLGNAMPMVDGRPCGGKGAVFSDYTAWYVLDPTYGDLDRSKRNLYAKCAGQAPVAPLPTTNKDMTFLGWKTGPDGTGDLRFNADGSPAEGFTVVPYEGKVTLYADWKDRVDEVTVTTVKDGENLGEGIVTLRDAIRVMKDPKFALKDGSRVIFFACADNTMILTNTINVVDGYRPFAIDGRNGGNGMRISQNYDEESGIAMSNVYFDVKSEVTFRNMEFSMAHNAYGSGGAVTASSGKVGFENCAFNDCFAQNKGGAVYAEGESSFLNCSFNLVGIADTMRDSYGGAVYAGDKAEFTNCMFTESVATMGAAVFSVTNSTFIGCSFVTCGESGTHAIRTGRGDLVVSGSVFFNNGGDIYNGGTLKLYGVTHTGKLAGAEPSEKDYVDVVSADEALFAEEYITIDMVSDTVTHRVMRPLCSEKIVAYVPSTDYSCPKQDLLGMSAESSNVGRGALRGEWFTRLKFDPGLGHVPGTNDCVVAIGNEPEHVLPAVLPGLSFVGWYQGYEYYDANGDRSRRIPQEPEVVLTAKWKMTTESMTVDTEGDSDDPFDGVTSLREAIRALGVDPHLTLDDGTRTIRFNCGEQLVLTNQLYSESAIDIDGYNGGKGLTLIALEGRILRGKESIKVRNLTFADTNDISEDGGGAIYAGKGLVASNCVFRGCTTLGNGAAVHAYGQSVFVDCTFYRNRLAGSKTDGGAIYAEGDVVCVNSTFAWNRADNGSAVYGKQDVFGINCTIVDNDAQSSAVYASYNGSRLINCLFAGGNGSNPYSDRILAYPVLIADDSQDMFAFDGELQECKGGAVNHYVFKPFYDSQYLTESSVIVLHDADWKNIAYKSGAQSIRIVGDKEAATIELNTDQVGLSETMYNGKSMCTMGAFRNLVYAKVHFDPDGGRYSGDEDIYAACDNPLPANTVFPTWGSRAFLGWYEFAQEKGKLYVDGAGMPTSEKLPFARDITVYAGWGVTPEMMVVTTTADGVDRADGKVTLRDAVNAMIRYPSFVSPDGTRNITFNIPASMGSEVQLSSTISIGGGTPAFAIDGMNGGKGVTISAADGMKQCLLEYTGEGLAISNLTIRGAENANGNGGAIRAEGFFGAANCLFIGNSASGNGGAIALSKSSSFVNRSIFVNCSFAGNVSANGGAVYAQDGISLDFTACSFTENCSTNDTTGMDVYVQNGTMSFASCTLDHNAGPGNVLSDNTLVWDAQPSIFAPGVQTQLVGVVSHVYRRALCCDAVTNGVSRTAMPVVDLLGKSSAILAKGAAFSELAVRYELDPLGGTVGETNVYFVCGQVPDYAPIATRARYDFAGWYTEEDGAGVCHFDSLGVSSGVVAPYAESLPLKAYWMVTSELLRVTSSGDDPSEDVVTLREAIASLSKYTFADPKITFDGVSTVTLKSRLEISSGANPITIDGGDNGATIVMGGSGDRLIAQDQGTTIRLSNLNLIGGNSPDDDGGAILSKGQLVAENCSFRSNVGSAIEFHGIGALVDCTFKDNNSQSYGGAVKVSNGSDVVVSHCTFADNVSVSGGGAMYVSGKASVIACTFVANDASGNGGGVFVDSVGSLKLYSCALANTGSGSGVDLKVDGQIEAMNSVVTELPDKSVSGLTKLSKSAIFVNATDRASRLVRGVQHVYFVPVTDAPMDGGYWVWHDADWRNVAYSKVSQSSDRRPFVGAVSMAMTLKARDAVGNLISLSIIGAVTAEEGSLIVTTCADIVDPSDGVTSLREAVNAANHHLATADDDGRYSIIFDASIFEDNLAKVVLTTQVERIESGIVVRGPTDGRRVVLDVAVHSSSSSEVSVFDCPENGAIEFRDIEFAFASSDTEAYRRLIASKGNVDFTGCTFRGCSQAMGATIVENGGWLGLNDCSFIGNWTEAGAGGIYVQAGKAIVNNCTFANNTTGSKGVLIIDSGAEAFVVNSTFNGNKAANGAIFVVKSNPNVRIVNCVLVGNTTGDGANDVGTDDGSVTAQYSLIHSLYSVIAQPPDLSHVVNCDSILDSDAFAAGLESCFRGGVDRYFRRLNRVLDSNGMERGCFVYHDDAWANVAYSQYDDTYGKVNIVGTNRFAKTIVRTDVVGRERVSIAAPGSYATSEDSEIGDIGEIEINSGADQAGKEKPYDGIVTLREAVDFAERHPTFRDTNGNCTITFGDGFFKNEPDGVVISKMRQMEISSFTNGMLLVRGPAHGIGVTLDGDGKFRAFHVGKGNRVCLENLSFTNCQASTQGVAIRIGAGGAIHNAGTMVVSNCSFAACSSQLTGYAYGGAVYTAPGATSLVERCSFTSCKAGLGGAIHTDDGGSCAIVMSTIANCAALRSGSVYGMGGAVYDVGGNSRTTIVNCTITGNVAEEHGGGVYTGEKVSPSVTLHMLNDIVVGNSAAVAGDDLFVEDTAGKGKAAYCSIGATNVFPDDRLVKVGVKLGLGAADMFAKVMTTGAGIVHNKTVGSVGHSYFPLNKDNSYEARFVRADPTWMHVGYMTTPTSTPTVFVGQLARIRQAGVVLAEDQIGDDALALAMPGAVSLPESPEGPVTPEDPENPLLVDPVDFYHFTNVVAIAAANPSLASNGCITITFAGSGTINFENEIIIPSVFESIPLVIRGPVTFVGNGSTRLLSLEPKARLQLEQVALLNGVGEPNGGAVYVQGASLKAVDCAFIGNRANDSEWGGYGGAVAFENDEEGFESHGVFVNCLFAGNEAVSAGSYVGMGHHVYHDDTNLELYNCIFDGSNEPGGDEDVGYDVDTKPRVRVEKVDGTFDYFDTVAMAVTDCRYGDKLVILDMDNAPSPEQIAMMLPSGVTISGEGEYIWTVAAIKTRALADAGTTWYSATVTSATGGMAMMKVALNDSAAPEFGDDVDLANEKGAITVMPENIKPLLEYGLGRSDTLAGPFVVAEDGWVRADGNGVLPRALTAAKGSESSFYRIIVRE